MARGDFLPGVVLPPNGLMDAVLSACHPLAPVISIAVRTLSAAYVDGWVPANHLTPGVVLHATGTLAGLLRLTTDKVGEVLDAMDATGLLTTGTDGARRMADHEVIIGAVADVNVRHARRESRNKTRANKYNRLDGVCLTNRDHCLPHEKTTEDNATMTPGHDAPAGSSTVQDRHYQSSPSGSCSKKETGEIGIGGCGGKGEENHPSRQAARSRRLSADDATRILAMARTREPTPSEWTIERRLCVRMLRLMVGLKPDRVLPTPAALSGWETDMRLLLKDRHGNHAAINRVMMWALQPGGFWAPNVASPSKLRQKFDQIEAQMQREGAQAIPIPPAATTTPPPYVRVFRLEDEGRVS